MDTLQTQNVARGNALHFIAGEWIKGRDIVRVQISEYRNKATLDIRTWYTAPDGELKPSPKGITLMLGDGLTKLSDALACAKGFAKANGLMGDEEPSPLESELAESQILPAEHANGADALQAGQELPA